MIDGLLSLLCLLVHGTLGPLCGYFPSLDYIMGTDILSNSNNAYTDGLTCGMKIVMVVHK